MEVPQFRDGECEGAPPLGRSGSRGDGLGCHRAGPPARAAHQEPHVRGLGYGQYGDEAEDIESTGIIQDNETPSEDSDD